MPADERAAIRDSPADDTARLVFADWLEEHDDPHWAAFIRAQIGGHKSPHLGAHLRAWEETLREVVGRWWGEPRPTVRFARGFVETLQIGITDFVPHAARLLALFADEPLTRIELPGLVPSASTDGERTWWTGGRWTLARNWSGRELPARLFRLLPGGFAPYGLQNIRRYPSLSAAEHALSEACLAFANLNPIQ